MLVNAVVLTSGARPDRIEFAGDEDIVVGGVVKGAVTVVVAIRAMEQRKGIVEIGSE